VELYLGLETGEDWRSTTRRTHHVPECYLKNFSNSKRQVWAYSRESPPFPVNISDICVRKGLYDEDTERMLEKMESQTSLLLQRLITEQNTPVMHLGDDEQEVLSSFIGYMSSRNPYALDELKRIHNVHCDLMIGLAVSDFDHLISYLRETGLGINAKSIKKMSMPDSASELRRSVEEAVHAQWLPKLAEYGEKTANLLREKRFWVIARAQPGRFFISSDTPAVLAELTKEPGSEIMHIEGLAHFPICPNQTILVSDDDLRLDRDGITNRQTRILNCFEMHYAWRFVYSDRNEAFIDGGRRVTRHHPRNHKDL